MIIRQEQLSDYDAVYRVVQTAFKNAEHSDGNEQDLVSALRNSGAFVPELSLVAVCQGKIVGHILFTKVTIGEKTELALAPLSVLPDYQHRGIGQALMEQGHKTAQKLGYEYCVVLGHPQYYPKAGYQPASLYGIKAPFEVDDECFMAKKINPNAMPISGTVKYDDAFGV